MDPLLLIVIGAALAGFAQGVSGFAYSLVALSVWAWGVDPALAAPMANVLPRRRTRTMAAQGPTSRR